MKPSFSFFLSALITLASAQNECGQLNPQTETCGDGPGQRWGIPELPISCYCCPSSVADQSSNFWMKNDDGSTVCYYSQGCYCFGAEGSPTPDPAGYLSGSCSMSVVQHLSGTGVALNGIEPGSSALIPSYTYDVTLWDANSPANMVGYVRLPQLNVAQIEQIRRPEANLLPGLREVLI